MTKGHRRDNLIYLYFFYKLHSNATEKNTLSRVSFLVFLSQYQFLCYLDNITVFTVIGG